MADILLSREAMHRMQSHVSVSNIDRLLDSHEALRAQVEALTR